MTRFKAEDDVVVPERLIDETWGPSRLYWKAFIGRDSEVTKRGTGVGSAASVGTRAGPKNPLADLRSRAPASLEIPACRPRIATW